MASVPAAVATEADLALIAAAAGCEVRVTVRQLQDWRQDGLIPSPTVRHLGRGRGTASSYPEGTVAQVVAAARALDADRNRDRAVLRIFAAGHSVPEPRLRAAYEVTLTKIEDDARRMLSVLSAEAAEDAEATELVRSASRRSTVRQWRRRLGRGGQANAILRSVLTNLAMIAVEGDAVTNEGFVEMCKALGADDLPLDELAVASAALADLRGTARSASLDDLRWAVDGLRTVVRFWQTFRLVVERTGSWSPDLGQLDGLHSGWSDGLDAHDDLAIALVALVFLSANDGERHDQVAKEVALCEGELPRFLAVLHLTDALDQAQWRYLGLGGSVALSRLSPDERERYFAAVRTWCDHHPDEAEAIAPT